MNRDLIKQLLKKIQKKDLENYKKILNLEKAISYDVEEVSKDVNGILRKMKSIKLGNKTKK